MRPIFCSTLLLITYLFFASCKKSNSNDGGLASLNIIEASINVPSIIVNFSDTAIPYYLNQVQISYGSAMEYGIPSGAGPYVIVSSNDTSTPLLQGLLHLTAGSIYSLYLAGQAGQLDTVFMQDIIPVHSDSSSGVRFINLSAGSRPITINLQGNNPEQTEFPALNYKQISSFKSYPDTNGISSYNFEVRDQESGNLLTTASWNFTVFKNNTIVIYGSEDPSSSSPIGVFQVNNF